MVWKRIIVLGGMAAVIALGTWLILLKPGRSLPDKAQVALVFAESKPCGANQLYHISLYNWESGKTKALASFRFSNNYFLQSLLGYLETSGKWIFEASNQAGMSCLLLVDANTAHEIQFEGNTGRLMFENAVVNDERIIVPTRTTAGLELRYYQPSGRLVFRHLLPNVKNLSSELSPLSVSKDRIAVAAMSGKSSHILLYDRVGRFLTDLGRGESPHMDMAGTTLVFYRHSDNSLIKYNIKTGSSTLVESTSPRGISLNEQLVQLSSFDVTPDGRWLIVLYVNSDGIGLGLATFAVDLQTLKQYRLPIRLDSGMWMLGR